MPQLKAIKDKTLLGAITARTIVAEPHDHERVLQRAAMNKIELWLPEGIIDSRMHTLHKHKPFRVAPTAKLVSMRMPKRNFLVPRAAGMHAPFTRGRVCGGLPLATPLQRSSKVNRPLGMRVVARYGQSSLALKNTIS